MDDLIAQITQVNLEFENAPRIEPKNFPNTQTSNMETNTIHIPLFAEDRGWDDINKEEIVYAVNKVCEERDIARKNDVERLTHVDIDGDVSGGNDGFVAENDVQSKDSINWTNEDIGDVIEFHSDDGDAFEENEVAASEDDDNGLPDYESDEDDVAAKDNSDDEENKVDAMARELWDRRFRSGGVQIMLEVGQVFNYVKEFKSVLMDFTI